MVASWTLGQAVRRWQWILGAAVGCLVFSVMSTELKGQGKRVAERIESQAMKVLKQRCFRCHGAKKSESGL